MAKTYKGEERNRRKKYEQRERNRKMKTFDYSILENPPAKKEKPREKYVPHSERNIDD